jgi:hypothetical protein
MTPIRVGLVDMTRDVNPDLMQAAAASLNIQVTRDLPQFWNVQATVEYLPNARRIPAGVWPVQLVSHLPAGEGGVHLDHHNQPYAKVLASPDASWTIDASHEILEMLVDPFGNKLQTARSIEIVGSKVQDGPGEFSYLVEACDPCEANQFGYSIQGVLVSDFLTPHYYDPVVAQGTRYSFTGAIESPRQMLAGGYISFVNLETDEWQQILWLDPNGPPQLRDLGPAQGRSLRGWIDAMMAEEKTGKLRHHAVRARAPEHAHREKERRERLERIAALRAERFAAAAE